MTREYVIWSIEHTAWWRPAWHGYTRELREAGIYNEHEAVAILERANVIRTNEAMIPLDAIPEDVRLDLYQPDR